MIPDIEADLPQLTAPRRLTVADHEEFLAALLRPLDLSELEELGEFESETPKKVAP